MVGPFRPSMVWPVSLHSQTSIYHPPGDVVISTKETSNSHFHFVAIFRSNKRNQQQKAEERIELCPIQKNQTEGWSRSSDVITRPSNFMVNPTDIMQIPQRLFISFSNPRTLGSRVNPVISSRNPGSSAALCCFDFGRSFLALSRSNSIIPLSLDTPSCK